MPKIYVDTDGGMKDLGRLIEILAEGADCMTTWEFEFAESMHDSYLAWQKSVNWLTPGQTDTIIKIFNKMLRNGDI